MKYHILIGCQFYFILASALAQSPTEICEKEMGVKARRCDVNSSYTCAQQRSDRLKCIERVEREAEALRKSKLDADQRKTAIDRILEANREVSSMRPSETKPAASADQSDRYQNTRPTSEGTAAHEGIK